MPISSIMSVLTRLQEILPAEQVALFFRADTWQPIPSDAVFSAPLLDQVIHTRTSVLIKDTLPNLLAVPVQRKQQFYGVLQAAGTFKKRQIAVLEMGAEQLGLLLENDRLQHELSSAQQEISIHHEISQIATQSSQWEKLLPGMAERMAKLFEADICAITLWDSAEKRTRRLAAWGIDEQTFLDERKRPVGVPSLTPHIVQTMQPIFIHSPGELKQHPTPLIEEYDAKALVAVPLIARGRAFGAAFLMRLREGQPFTQEDVAAAELSLNHMALAIDNQLLLYDTQKRLQETNILLEIATITATTSELDDMLKQVLQLCREILKVKAGAVLLYNPESDTLIYRQKSGGFGFSEVYREVPFLVQHENSPLAEVFNSPQPRFFNDLSELPENFQKIAQVNHLSNILIAPLRVHNYPVGIFVVGEKPDGFQSRDAGLLMAMGSHVAAAIRNHQLLENTREQLRKTEVLQRIAAITSATLEIDEMLQVAVAEMAEVLNAEGAFLLLPDSSRSELLPHEPSLYGTVRDWSLKSWPLNGAGHQVEVFHTGQPYISNDPPTTLELPRRNVMTVPLNTRQETLGVLSVLDRHEGSFTPSQCDLAIAIASQIAVSLASAQSFIRERQRADLMQVINRITQEFTALLDMRGLLRTVAQNIHQYLGYNAVYIYQMDDDNRMMTCHACTVSHASNALEIGREIPVAERSLFSRVLETQRTLLLNHIDTSEEHLKNLANCMIVPLKRGSRIFGFIEIRTAAGNEFGDNEKAAIENLASQVSTAVDNAWLYNQAQQRLLEQGIVHQIGQDLTSILDYSELVSAVARHMARALDTSRCIVATYNAAQNAIHIEAEFLQRTYHPERKTLEIHSTYTIMNNPALQHAMDTHRAVDAYVDDEGTLPEQRQQLRQDGIFSQLIVPMVIGERVIGVILWTEGRKSRRFSPDDIRLAQTLVQQAAIAIDNARLFRESERRAREQALLRQVALTLSAAHGVDALVARLAREVQAAMEADNTLISLVNDDGWLIIRARTLTNRQPSQMVLGIVNSPQSIPNTWQSLKEGEIVCVTPHVPQKSKIHQELDDLLGESKAVTALAPISHRGKMIGVVEVSWENRHFDVETLQLLEALANQAALAIENVRLAEREQRRLYQMERIQKSGRLITSELVMQNLLELVVTEAAAIFDVPAVAVSMPDKFNFNYVVQAAYGLSENYIRERRSPIRKTPGEIAAMDEKERRKPIYYVEVSQTVKGYQSDVIRAEDLRSALFVPLVKGVRMFGTLELYSKATPHHFSDEDLEIAQLLASQIAIALDNADLFKALEARAEELAQANRLKSQFLANVSHELRTPMNSILGFSDALLTGIYGNLNENQSSRVERILKNGRSLLALIDDLLDISKIDAGRMQLELDNVNLGEEIHSVLTAIEGQIQPDLITLAAEIPDDLPPVQADPLRLRQIITNLLSNAVKFTKQGEIKVFVELKNETRLNPKPDENPTQEVVWVSVKDTGIGIKLEDQLIIFDEFRQADGSTTREYGGTGLGLAISKKLIEMMGGRIWVDSETGQGSTFTFVLPTSRN